MMEQVVEWGYRAVLWAGGRIPRRLRGWLYTAGLAISPALSLADEERRRERSLWLGTVVLVPLVLLFSFGFNALFSGFEGRLRPDADPNTVNFLEDKINLILYIVVCPLYIALSLQIILVSSRYGVGVRDPKPPASLLESSRSPTAISLCLAVAAVLVANYIADVGVGAQGPTYWFNDRIGGVRVLNGAGVYYVLMTFAFLTVVFLALLNYLSITQASVRLANSVTVADCSDMPAMRDAFLRFRQSYVLARWLIAIFMIHTAIWSRSPLAKTENIHMAGAALILAAFFLTAIPARHLDRKVSAAAEACGKTLDELGIEPTGAKAWLPWADWIIGGCFFFLWGWEPFDQLTEALLGERQLN